jgi:hypothetical protein
MVGTGHGHRVAEIAFPRKTSNACIPLQELLQQQTFIIPLTFTASFQWMDDWLDKSFPSD